MLFINFMIILCLNLRLNHAFIVFFNLINYNDSMRKALLIFTFSLFFIVSQQFLNSEIYNLEIKGPIDSISEEYITDSYEKIDNLGNGELIIISIDTPGGFSTSMRTIIKTIMNSRIPTAVYVSPSGARAASAGFLITISAHIAVMAPGTNMGAAHPVSVMGKEIDEVMKKKITNDAVSYIRSIAKSRGRNTELSEKAVRESSSFTAEECLKGNLIDMVAENIEEIIKRSEGMEIYLSDGKKSVLKFTEKTISKIGMTMRQRFLRTITNPNLAYFLLIIGLAGLYIEFTHPGVIIPGVLGAIALLLAFLAFQILPVNYTGLFLILLSIGFFIAEIKIQGFGILGIGGIISFVLGSIMLINSPIPELRPALTTIITASAVFGTIFLFLAYKVISVSSRRTETGAEGMVGEMGKTRSPVNQSSGKVFIKGEIWNAVSEETIDSGEIVEILSVDNLVLKVKKGE